MADEKESAFDDPNIAINRVYTKKGDCGKTDLVGGQNVDKDDPRIDSYGTVDELNSFVGVARESVREAESRLEGDARDRMAGLSSTLLRVQHELFNLGSILATLPEDVHPRQPRVTDIEVQALESSIDTCQLVLEPLGSFVLPGGSRLNAELHLARTVCRRAERLTVALSKTSTVDADAIRYLNRLSDAFFVWSRYASHLEGVAETLWRPNESASGKKTT